MITEIEGWFPFQNNGQIRYVIKRDPSVSFACEASINYLQGGDVVLSGSIMSVAWVGHSLKANQLSNRSPRYHFWRPKLVFVSVVTVEAIKFVLHELWEREEFFLAFSEECDYG